jgi:nifR3 family TIM-barrel protein
MFTMSVRLGNIKLDNPFVQAPLAGITDPPFRTIARRFHKGLLFSEMISAEALCRGNTRTRTYFRIDEAHHPIALQIVGPKAERLAEAARFIEGVGADFVDINSGCPDRKLVRDGAGGALLKDLKNLAHIARTVVKAVKIPVSIKLRLGHDKDDSLEILKALADTGVAFITVNGYTVAQRFSGKSDWEALRRLAEASKDLGIPLVANGGATDEAKAVEMLEFTKATGVMIGRATRGRPDLPGTADSLLKTGTFERMDNELLARTIHDHAALEVEVYGEAKGMRRMRKLVMWYLKAARIRSWGQEVNALTTVKEMDAVVQRAISAKENA